MHWFQGLPEIAAMLVGTGAAVAAALWLAVRIAPRFGFAWLFPSAERAPAHGEIGRLASLADLAKGEGVLALEAHAGRRGDEVLSTGIRLLIEGVPAAELRRGLEEALDEATAADARRGGGRWVRLMHLLVFAAAVLGLIGVWSLGIAAGTTGGAVLGLLVCYASLLALAFVGPVCDRVLGGGASAAAMRGVMSLETVMLIERRADGAAVRSRLMGLLPPTSREAMARAAA